MFSQMHKQRDGRMETIVLQTRAITLDSFATEKKRLDQNRKGLKWCNCRVECSASFVQMTSEARPGLDAVQA